jgi:hypothetical protein
MQTYAGLCAWALARAHAQSGDAAMIAGYMGASATFDDAIGEFAMEYADQNERDYKRFVTAVKEGRIEATVDVYRIYCRACRSTISTNSRCASLAGLRNSPAECRQAGSAAATRGAAASD